MMEAPKMVGEWISPAGLKICGVSTSATYSWVKLLVERVSSSGENRGHENGGKPLRNRYTVCVVKRLIMKRGNGVWGRDCRSLPVICNVCTHSRLYAPQCRSTLRPLGEATHVVILYTHTCINP